MRKIATKKSAKIIYPELSYEITGLLFKIHNELGRYAREKQYSDLFDELLRLNKLKFEREKHIGNSGNILDFIIEDKIVIEFKSTRLITREMYRQIQNYLQQTNLRLGLLVNFRSSFLKPIRIIRIDPKPSLN